MIEQSLVGGGECIRSDLSTGTISIGSWQQIPGTDVDKAAEIIGRAGCDWIVMDNVACRACDVLRLGVFSDEEVERIKKSRG